MTTLTARLGILAAAQPKVAGFRLVERNAMVYRRTWVILFSGFFEPLLYLLAFGVGLGGYVGTVTLDGETLDYAVFIAPGLLAVSAMNGAFYDATNVFWKLRYAKVYDSVLATPIGPRDVAVGESLWAVFRSLLYSAAFLCLITAMGLVESWWALLALPAALLIGLAFAGAGIAAVTWMRTWKDFEILNLFMLPLFLFSATFYPITVYPQVLQWVVQALPLYHGVALIRALTTGAVGPEQLLNVLYLVVLGLIGIALAGRRIHGLLLT